MAGPRRRSLSQTDRDHWAAFASLIRPLKGREAVEPPPAAAVPAPVAAAGRDEGAHPFAPLPPAPRARPAALVVGDAPGGLDRSTWQKFRTGKLAAQRTLDLHGRTAQRAYDAMEFFLREAARDRVRCVEIITGRGSGETGGVIRREFPMWLNMPALRPLVLAASHPHARNQGSVRLLLRRPK